MNRRRFLSAAFAGSIGALLWPYRSLAASDEPSLYCEWRFTGETRCRYGTREEKWEYLCCEGISCEIWFEEWRPIGSC